MKYNRSEIMKAAWGKFRKYNAAARYNHRKDEYSFSYCLKEAWREAKTVANVKNHFMSTIRGCTLYIDKGVIACAGRMGWSVTGKTFAVKNDLRSMGFRWDCESRCWYTEDAATAAKLA